jgi:hypothetical protein
LTKEQNFANVILKHTRKQKMETSPFAPPTLETAATPQQLVELSIQAGSNPPETALAVGATVEVEPVGEAQGGAEHDYHSFKPFTHQGHEYADYSGSYETNDPEAIDDLFSRQKKGFGIQPAKLDEVPLGNYVITRRAWRLDPAKGVSEPELDRQIIVSEGPRGRVFNPDAFKHRDLNKQTNEGTQVLMRALGYAVGADGKIEGTPTPLTIKENALRLGVDIDLLETGAIDGRRYLRSYAAGKYPVGAGEEYWYAHDINDDHVTAMVLGGQPLKELLRTAATNVLAANAPNRENYEGVTSIDDAASAMDTFTNSLGGLLYNRRGQISEGYEGMLRAGTQLGITKQQIDELIISARTKAQVFGVKLRPEAEDFQFAVAA